MCWLTNSVLASPELIMSKEYWSSPAFLKSFNGSYRINARIEPSVSSQERELLVSIQSYMQQGKRQKALEVLQKSKHQGPPIKFNQGNLYFELGQEKQAKEAYLAAIEGFPSFRRAHRNLGLMYYRLGEVQLALEALVEAVSLGDLDGTTMGWLGRCHLELGRPWAALEAFQRALMTQPRELSWRVGAAQCYQQLEEWEKSLPILREAVQEQPQEYRYTQLLVQALLQAGSREEALVSLEWLRDHQALTDPLLVQTIELHYQLGTEQIAAQRLKEVPWGQMELERVFYLLERLYGYDRDLNVASMIQQVGSRDDLDKNQRLDLEILSVKNQARHFPKKARGLYDQLLTKDPRNGQILYDYSLFLMGQKDWYLADLQIQRGLEVGPQDPAMWFLAGQVQVQLGQIKKAIESYRKVLSLQPSQELELYIQALESSLERNK